MNKRNNSTNLTRRALVRAGGLGIATSALLPLLALAQPQKTIFNSPNPQKRPKAATTHLAPSEDEQSVFQQCAGDFTKDEGSIKYTGGDKLRTFPVYALWLMLTTENWDKCIADPKWKNGLFEELIGAYNHANAGSVQPGDHDSLIAQFNSLINAIEGNKESFVSVGATWRSFIASDNAFYGGRPCPGGGTILGVAGLTHKPTNTKSKSRKK